MNGWCPGARINARGARCSMLYRCTRGSVSNSHSHGRTNTPEFFLATEGVDLIGILPAGFRKIAGALWLRRWSIPARSCNKTAKWQIALLLPVLLKSFLVHFVIQLSVLKFNPLHLFVLDGLRGVGTQFSRQRGPRSKEIQKRIQITPNASSLIALLLSFSYKVPPLRHPLNWFSLNSMNPRQ